MYMYIPVFFFRKKSPYIQAVYDLSEIIAKRFPNPFYHINWIFHMVPLGYKFRRACKLVHDYSKGIILTRRTYTSQVRLVYRNWKTLHIGAVSCI